MRPGGGWGSGNENGESDALQADVMRFVAIIALCLAAIFSLLSGIRNTPELEPRERISRPPGELPETVVEAGVTETKPATSSLPVEADEQGLILEFASAKAMEKQLSVGEVGLYVMADGQSWRWQPANGVFSQVALPAQLYQLDISTVPEHYRRVFAVQEPDSVRAVSWGVSLSRQQVEAIDRWTGQRQSGLLLIDSNGSVRYLARTQGAA